MGLLEVRLEFDRQITIDHKSTTSVRDAGLHQLGLQTPLIIIPTSIIVVRKRFQYRVGLVGRIDAKDITDADVAMLEASFDRVAIACSGLGSPDEFD
jgi:hypothetical protein